MNPIEINREAWDRRTGLHVASDFYDVEGFLGGACALKEIELGLLGDVAGKSLLHLQCHFGLDTLSWARRGAAAIGVDFSPAAIAKANELRDQTGLDVEFVCADVSEPRRYGAFDVVFASYGTVIWLPDVEAWARVVAENLKPGGRVCFVEFHPIHEHMEGYPYFGEGRPIVEEEGTYTENDTGETSPMVTWAHPVSRVVNALIDAGIRIDRFDEYPYSPYDCFAGLEEVEPGRFKLEGAEHDRPLVYSILGTKS